MLVKTRWRARTALLWLLLSGCESSQPWLHQPPGEVNLAFTLDRNVVYLNTVLINGRAGRYVFASANARTAFDPALVSQLPDKAYRLQLNDRASLNVSPVVLPLGGLADAVIGADVWGAAAVTIDYRSGLVSYQRDGIHPTYMTLFSFTAEPTILVDVNGQNVPAVVDTSSPDTLVLPRRTTTDRAKARVTIAGTQFGEIDVGLADTTTARVGNRVLSKFLITIDYGRRQVGLWRDPRIPLR